MKEAEGTGRDNIDVTEEARLLIELATVNEPPLDIVRFSPTTHAVHGFEAMIRDDVPTIEARKVPCAPKLFDDFRLHPPAVLIEVEGVQTDDHKVAPRALYVQ